MKLHDPADAMRWLTLATLSLLSLHLFGQQPVERFRLPGYQFQFPNSEGGNWFAKAFDFDGDGDLDLYLGRSFQEDQIYLNNGDGTFCEGPEAQPWMIRGGSYDAEFLHLNGDTLLDMVVARGPANGRPNDALVENHLPGRELWLLRQPDGSLLEAPSANFPVDSIYYANIFQCAFLPQWGNADTSNFSMGVAKGDLNADGMPDLVFANGGVQYLIGIDFEGDNFCLPKRVDLLENDVYFSRPDTNGDGVFEWEDATQASGIIVPDLSTDVAIADFNGDQRDDVLILNFYDRCLADQLNMSDSLTYSTKLYLNDSLQPGNFTWRPDLLPAGTGQSRFPATEVEAVDLEGDGDVDLVIAAETRARELACLPGEIWQFEVAPMIWLNDGTGKFTDATDSLLPAGFLDHNSSAHLHSTFEIRVADMNGDSTRDLFGAGIKNWLLLQRDDGSGLFEDATHLLPAHKADSAPHTFHAYGAAVADFTGDGRPDIFLADTYEQNRLQWQLPDGRFVDTTTTNLPPDGEDTWDAAIADFNQDGLPDIAVAHADRFNDRSLFMQTAHIRDSFPWFRDVPENLPRTSSRNRGVATADVDKDGRYDLLFTAVDSTKIFRNEGPDTNGNPVFSDRTASWLAGLSLPTYSNHAEFVDLNRDGWQDIFIPAGNTDIVSPVGAANQLLLWDSVAMRYVDYSHWLPAYPSGQGASPSVDFAHLNNDSWLDVLVAEQNLPTAIYLSDTDSVASPGYQLLQPFPDQPSSDAKFGDLNQDGFVDVVEVIKEQDIAREKYLHLNRGLPGIPQFDTHLLPFYDREDKAIVIHPLDGDNYPDVVVAGRTGARVLLWRPQGDSLFDATAFYFQIDTITGSAQSTHALVLADVNLDGYQDLYMARDNQDWLFYGCDAAGLCGDTTSVAILPIQSTHPPRIVAFPNPYEHTTTLRYTLPEGAEVRLDVYDVQGRLLQHHAPGWQFAGMHDFHYNGEKSGVQIVVLQAGKAISTTKLLNLR